MTRRQSREIPPCPFGVAPHRAQSKEIRNVARLRLHHAGLFVGVRHPVALSLKVAATLNNLAELYTTQGRYTEAEPLYKRSLTIWEKALGPNHPNVALSLENIAALYRATNRAAEADKLEKRVERIRAIKR